MVARPRFGTSPHRTFIALACCLALAAGCGSSGVTPLTPTLAPSPSSAPVSNPTSAAPAAQPTLAPTAAPTSPAVVTTSATKIRFATDGDEINGWYWLRDPEGATRAMWVFEPVAESGDLAFDLTVLATDAVNGGPDVDATFWLSYGSTSDPGRPLDPQLVTLPNVSPPDDPVGYTTEGMLTIPRSTLPDGTTSVWIRISRTDHEGNGLVSAHIAVAGGSVTPRGAEADAIPLPSGAPAPVPSPEPSLAPAAPLPGFVTDGDYIQGWWWLRDAAGTDRGLWTFSGIPQVGDIVLDLFVLATDRVSGGPGVDAEFWLSYGTVSAQRKSVPGPRLGEAYVQLPNVSPPGDPVGYTTRDQFVIPRSLIPGGTTILWVQITRSDHYGDNVISTHIAVNEGSVTISGGGGPSASPSGSAPASATPGPTPTAQPTPAATPGDGPGRGTPTVVSVGDSYIAGEGGRWAGNINLVGLLDSGDIDALGPDAYYDNADRTGEEIAGCHRSESAEIHIGANPYGPTVNSENLACSGATTQTSPTEPGDTSDYKPGLDAFGDIDGNLLTDEATAAGARISQAVALRQFAKTHNVKMVVVSIGGNNFQFGGVVKQCVEDFLYSSYYWKDYCKDDAIADNFNSANTALRTAEIRAALQNVHDAMTGAGYSDSMWTMVVQTYPGPIPGGGGIRYEEKGFTRQTVGGCGFWNADADWAVGTVLPTVNAAVKAAVAGLPFSNKAVMDVSNLFTGRRLCESTVGTLNDKDLDSWQDAGAVDKTEWVVPIRGIWNADNVGGSSPYQQQESFHPNYWGQLALRNCVRQAYSNGAVRGGMCLINGYGLNDRGEPVVLLYN